LSHPEPSLKGDPKTDWALALFQRSVLKQAKYAQILARLADPEGKVNLDIGADNGVISYLLRQHGGQWYSADLDEHTVASIRQLVGTGVYRIDGRKLPFDNGSIDQVVIVDFLEHIPDDASFIRELARVIKPGGRLIINVPHLKPHSIINRIRHAIGLTDAWHGHLRPGYDLSGLTRLLTPHFAVSHVVTYSRCFSELIDTGLNGLYQMKDRRKSGKAASGKGTVVTRSDMQQHRKEFMLLSILYPLLRVLAGLDVLLPLQSGYKLIVEATRLAPQGDEPTPKLS
jgi:SAM-dependent methyltransferase